MAGGDKLTINLSGTQKMIGGAVLAVALIGGFGFAAMNIGPIIGSISGDTPTPDPSTGDDTPSSNADQVAWNEYKDLVGLKFPAQTAGETIVFIPEGTTAENYGSANVVSVGADSDETDTTELFASSEVEEGTDYYTFTTFDSAITSGLPDSGNYSVAIIGSNTANEYRTVNIPDMVDRLRVEQSAPLQPLSNVEVMEYAADANVSVTNTVVNDGDSTIALDNNFADDTADNQVDGSVTGVRSYELAEGRVAQFGEISVSSVDASVNSISMTVLVDGEEVDSVSDSDFSDGEGLDDGVEIGTVTAEDSITVRTAFDYSDSDVTNSTALGTSVLDDVDSDSSSSDGSFGLTALSTTWTGY